MISSYHWHIVLVVQEGHAYNLRTTDIYITDRSEQYLAWYYHNNAVKNTLVPFDVANSLLLTPNAKEDNFTVWYMSPILSNKMVVLGETGKWVPMSQQRVSEFEVSATSIVIGLVGGAGEMVYIDWGMPMSILPSGLASASSVGDYMVMTAKCMLDAEGTAKLLLQIDMSYTC